MGQPGSSSLFHASPRADVSSPSWSSHTGPERLSNSPNHPASEWESRFEKLRVQLLREVLV